MAIKCRILRGNIFDGFRGRGGICERIFKEVAEDLKVSYTE